MKTNERKILRTGDAQSHLKMSSFIVELVSTASAEIYPQNTLSAFTNCLPEQLNLEGDWEVALLEISYPSLINNVTKGNF